MATAEMPSGPRSARLADDGKELIVDPLCKPYLASALIADFYLCLKQLPLLRYMPCALDARRPFAISLRPIHLTQVSAPLPAGLDPLILIRDASRARSTSDRPES